MSSEPAFAIDPQRPLLAELERIAREQLELARAQLATALESVDGGSAAAAAARLAKPVHEVRKAFKRLRALARLVRPGVPRRAYRRQNVLLRDAARQLAGGRDAHVMAELYGTLAAKGLSPAARRQLASFRRALTLRGQRLGRQLAADGRLAGVDASLAEADELLLQLVPAGPALEPLLDGARTAYGRARGALRQAAALGTDEAFHEWRKRVKYVRHHVELLQPAAAGVLGATAKLFHELADHLGDHNDLAVLAAEVRRQLAQAPAGSERAAAFHELLGLVDERQLELRARALELGRQLFAERPRAWAERLRRYWKDAARAAAQPA